jgi:hypothetical protein
MSQSAPGLILSAAITSGTFGPPHDRARPASGSSSAVRLPSWAAAGCAGRMQKGQTAGRQRKGRNVTTRFWLCNCFGPTRGFIQGLRHDDVFVQAYRANSGICSFAWKFVRPVFGSTTDAKIPSGCVTGSWPGGSRHPSLGVAVGTARGAIFYGLSGCGGLNDRED